MPRWFRFSAQLCASKLFALSVIVSVLLAFSVVEAETPANGSPRIHVAEPVVKFQNVLEGTPVVHAFELENTGGDVLSILQIQPDCGCTAAQPEATAIAPGEKTDLNVTFDTNGFHGYKVKTVRVYTNDPKNRSIVLTLQGTVVSDVDVNPPRVFFGPVKRGDTPEQKITITKSAEGTASIESVFPRSEFLEVAVVKDLAKSRTISVRLKDDVPLGIFRSSIIVKTTSPRNPVINLPVFARVLGDMVLEPTDVSFGLVEGPLTANLSHEVNLTNEGTEAVGITAVESDNPAVTATVSPGNSQNTFKVKVEIAAGSSGTLHAKVKLKTDHPDQQQQELILPVYGIISAQGA